MPPQACSEKELTKEGYLWGQIFDSEETTESDDILDEFDEDYSLFSNGINQLENADLNEHMMPLEFVDMSSVPVIVLDDPSFDPLGGIDETFDEPYVEDLPSLDGPFSVDGQFWPNEREKTPTDVDVEDIVEDEMEDDATDPEEQSDEDYDE